VSDLIALRAVSPVWDAIGHAMERCPHDLDGVVRVSREVAAHLLHNEAGIVHGCRTAAVLAMMWFRRWPR
jgi:hypothetical protein